MHYQFEEDSSLPKETIEILVRSRKYDQAVQYVLDYLAKFEQGRVEILPVKTAVRTELLRVSDLILVDVDGTSLILETTNGRLPHIKAGTSAIKISIKCFTSFKFLSIYLKMYPGNRSEKHRRTKKHYFKIKKRPLKRTFQSLFKRFVGNPDNLPSDASTVP